MIAFALSIGLKVGIAVLCLLTALAIGFAAEILRPETPEEERVRVVQTERAPDPWAGFTSAKAKARLSEELHEKELADVASIHAEQREELVIARREVA
jgi:hypothetical protein